VHLDDPRVLTLGDVSRRLHCPVWAVRRLFERGLLPAAPRVANLRVIPEDRLPDIKRALIEAGYLEEEAASSCP
jgi:hypothetical protein